MFNKLLRLIARQFFRLPISGCIKSWKYIFKIEELVQTKNKFDMRTAVECARPDCRNSGKNLCSNCLRELYRSGDCQRGH